MTCRAGLVNSRIAQVSKHKVHKRILYSSSKCHIILSFKTINIYINCIGHYRSIRISICRRNNLNLFVDFAQVEYNLTECKLNVLERIIMSKYYNSSIGIDLIQHKKCLAIVDIEAEIAINVRLSSECQNIQYRKFNSVVSLFAKLFSHSIRIKQAKN